MTEIQIYSDGSATTSQNAGGWASVVLIDGTLHEELSGHLESATNNDAELIAAIKGLDYTLAYLTNLQGDFPADNDVTLISDSEIILNWANGTYRFKQVDKMPLYEELRRLVKKMNVKTQWVKGHSGNLWNERCDRLANNARKKLHTVAIDKTIALMNTKIGSKKSGVVCLWLGNVLKVVDLDQNIVEDYDREAHGKRGSAIQIREEKDR